MDNMHLNPLGVVQNLGLVDRIVRLVIAWGLIAYAAFDLNSGAMVTWHGYAILFAAYPMFTGMFGHDPFYALLHARSCDFEGRNQCGTMPFEVAAALGKHPSCTTDYDCHLQPRKHDEHHGATA